MLEHSTSSHRQCSFAVNGCKYHENVSYQCNSANVSLAKYVTSHLIVAGNEKLYWTRLDILDACRNKACFLSPLDQIRDVCQNRYKKPLFQRHVLPYALMQHIR